MYRLSFKFLSKYSDYFLLGFKNTLIISCTALVFSCLLGCIFALMRNSKSRVFRTIASIWVNVLRNTPFLVQLFFFFYGLPELGIATSPLVVSIIALSINGSASNCEIIRAGLMAVKKGYYECSYALGYSKGQTLIYFIFPICFSLAFKSLTNNFINLFLTSSTCFATTLMELMGSSKTVSSLCNRPFEVFLLILVLYCVLTFAIAFICKAIDRKIHVSL